MVPPRSGKELLSLPPDEAAKLCKQKISVMRDALIRAHDGLTCDRSTDINWTYVWDQLTRAQVAVGTAVVVATGKMNPDREFEEMDTAEFKSIHDTPFVAGPIDSSPEGGAA